MYKQSLFDSLSLEVLLFIASYLDYLSLIRLAATSKRLSLVLKDDMLFKEMLFLDYGVSYKSPDETWREQYVNKWSDISGRRICPHLSSVTDDILMEKADTFKAAQVNKSACSKCLTSPFPNLMLLMEKVDRDILCRRCLMEYVSERQEQDRRHGIYLDMSTLKLRCYRCRMRRTPLGGFGSHRSEQYKCELILEVLLTGTDAGKERVELILKRKREKEMYVGQQSELASTDHKQLRCNLIDAHWMGRFHLFIYGEYPSPGPITNRTLTRRNGSVVPDLKLYGEDAALVTTNFWSQLEREYGVEGRAVTEGEKSISFSIRDDELGITIRSIDGHPFVQDDLKGDDYRSLRQKITQMKRKMCNQAKSDNRQQR